MANERVNITLDKAEAPFFVGIDVGGTNIKVGLVDNQGRTLAYDTTPTGTDQPAEAAAKRMGLMARRLIEETGVEPNQVVRAGLVTPGPIDIAQGLLVQPGNLPNWWNFPIRDRVSHYADLPVTFANDANAASYGEFWCGAACRNNSMIMLTLGTGVGGGIIVGDTIIEGQHGCGSECGHVIIDSSPDAPIDSLGKTGSLEGFCGSNAIVARTLAKINSGATGLLTERHAAGEKISTLMIFEAATANDPLALDIILETARYLGIGVATLVHVIDPDTVIFGGAITFGGESSPIGSQFIEEIRREARSRMLEPLRDKIRIEFAELGGDAGYLGSAGLARLDYLKQQDEQITLLA